VAAKPGARKKAQTQPGDSPKMAVSSRFERRKGATRQRLIDAAQVVMGRKGVEAATIADITEQADVGFGSFYNHFQSKEDIANEVFATQAQRLADELDIVFNRIDDPNLAAGILQRWFIETARRDPVWGWFMIHADSALPIVESTFHARICRGLERVVQLGRAPITSIDMAASITLAAIMATMRKALEGKLGVDGPSEMVEALLRMYGLPHAKAHALAFAPLPPWLGSGAKD
jgi:AcrR family transcriptional regulator